MHENPHSNVRILDRYRDPKTTPPISPDTLPGWLGQEDMKALGALLSRSPGQISQLVNQYFQVVSPWPEPGCMTTTGEYDLESWPVGSIGVVCSVMYDADGWSALIEHTKDQLTHEQRLITVSLPLLLRCTKPLVNRHEG